MRVLRAADRVAVPWKNGGGVTREVAIWPPGSGFDDFDWRVSIAEVSAAGPFSVFENIDRTMLILTGRLGLAFADCAIELDSHSAPFAFSGDVACSGAPLDGNVVDLNVMTRRGRCIARFEKLSAHYSAGGASHSLIVASAPTTLDIGGVVVALDMLDALLIGGDAVVQLRSGAGYLIALSAH